MWRCGNVGNVGQINISLAQWPHFAGRAYCIHTALHTTHTPLSDVHNILLVTSPPTPGLMYSVSVSAACYDENIQTRGRGQSLTLGHR